MTYTPKLPPRSAILDTWLRHHPFQYSSEIEDREAEFEMWEKQLIRKAKAEAWDEGQFWGREYHAQALAGEIPTQNPYTEES